MIKLENLTPDNLKHIHEIFPGEEGKYWVNFNWYWVELSKKRPQITSQLIYKANAPLPLGFVAYGQHFKDRQLEEAVPGVFELYHMIIDAGEQGKGFGRLATIHVLQKMASFEGCEKLVVACHPDNRAATNLYLSLGFQENGKNYDGDPLYVLSPDEAFDLAQVSNSKSDVERSRKGAARWRDESVENEKEFDWDAWEKGLEI